MNKSVIEIKMIIKNLCQVVRKTNISAERFTVNPAMNQMVTKRTAIFFTNSNFTKERQHQVLTSAGVLSAYLALGTMVALSPLDEFEKSDTKNFCYHRHFHPR